MLRNFFIVIFWINLLICLYYAIVGFDFNLSKKKHLAKQNTTQQIKLKYDTITKAEWLFSPPFSIDSNNRHYTVFEIMIRDSSEEGVFRQNGTWQVKSQESAKRALEILYQEYLRLSKPVLLINLGKDTIYYHPGDTIRLFPCLPQTSLNIISINYNWPYDLPGRGQLKKHSIEPVGAGEKTPFL